MKNKLVFIAIFFILFNFSAKGAIEPPFKNMLVLKNPKLYNQITFEDYDGNLINFDEFFDENLDDFFNENFDFVS